MSKVAPSPDLSESKANDDFRMQRSELSSRGRSGVPSPSSYESKKSGLTSFSLPTQNPNASLKQRITSVEDLFDLQVQTNGAVDSQITNLISSTANLDINIKDQLLEMKNKIDDDFAWMKKEFNHKYYIGSYLYIN
jgi:hypothetical protein